MSEFILFCGVYPPRRLKWSSTEGREPQQTNSKKRSSTEGREPQQTNSKKRSRADSREPDQIKRKKRRSTDSSEPAQNNPNSTEAQPYLLYGSPEYQFFRAVIKWLESKELLPAESLSKYLQEADKANNGIVNWNAVFNNLSKTRLQYTYRSVLQLVMQYMREFACSHEGDERRMFQSLSRVARQIANNRAEDAGHRSVKKVWEDFALEVGKEASKGADCEALGEPVAESEASTAEASEAPTAEASEAPTAEASEAPTAEASEAPTAEAVKAGVGFAEGAEAEAVGAKVAAGTVTAQEVIEILDIITFLYTRKG